MQTQIHTQISAPLNAFAFSGQQIEVRDMVAMFYKGTHTESELNNSFIQNLEEKLERLKQFQFSQKTLCATLQSKWRVILINITNAIQQFISSYKANFKDQNTLKSPYIKRLKRIEHNANLILFYIEV